MYFSFLVPAAASLLLASPAIAHPASGLAVEVTERNGTMMVREVARSTLQEEHSCTNCVHIGLPCTIGEGNCFTSEHASCIACGNRGALCVADVGTCDQP